MPCKAIRDTGAFDLGVLTITFGANDNEGLDDVFMTMIEASGKFKASRR